MDEVWKQSLHDTRASEEITRAWLENQVYRAVRDLRVEHGDYVDIRVLVPWCSACTHFESSALEMDMPMPDILGSSWKRYYRDLGMSAKETAHVWRGLRDGWRSHCGQCGTGIDFEEGVYVRSVDLSTHFDLYISRGRIPSWMKKAVREVFGTVCGECGGSATTLDHIVARARGGLNEVVNLRPLCEPCNGKKADHPVDPVQIILTFRLCPAPSDGYEGIIW